MLVSFAFSKFCDNGVKYVSVDQIIGQRVIKKASVKVTVCCWSFYWRGKSIFQNCEQNLKIQLIKDQINEMQSQIVLKNHSKTHATKFLKSISCDFGFIR